MTTPSVGAIRWDAWYANTSTSPAAVTAATLSDSDLQAFAPVHYRQSSTSKLTPVVPTQAIVDNEINVAASNGVSYWVYLMYGQTIGSPHYAEGLMNAWLLHQTSAIKGTTPWAAMMQPGMMGATGNFSAQVALTVSYFQQSNYFTVLSGRPLLYIYWGSGAADLTTYWAGSLTNFAAMITALRAATIAAGLPNPYIVVMNGAETSVYFGVGADAISNYIPSITQAINRNYSTYDASTQAYWATLASKGVPIVPIAASGATDIGRYRRPPTWVNTYIRPRMGDLKAVTRPSAAQLKSHIASARAYVAANPSVCPANTILLYSWNECDEGVGICPTIGNPSGMALV